LPRDPLEPLPVLLPPLRVHRRQVRVLGAVAGRAVDQLAHHVGVARVPVRFRHDVQQDQPQRHLLAALRPPRHASHRVQSQRIDGGVGVRPGRPVEIDHLLARLLSRRPHVGVLLGALVEPGLREAATLVEHLPEVAELDARQMLHESEEVGAGTGQRPAHVVLRRAVELPQHGVTPHLEVPQQVRLIAHGCRMALTAA
jgi:hypothetical protein